MMPHECLVDVGFNSFIIRDRIQAIFSPSSSAMKKLKYVAGQEQHIINLTYGYETKSIIMMDSGHIVLSGLSVEDFLDSFNCVNKG